VTKRPAKTREPATGLGVVPRGRGHQSGTIGGGKNRQRTVATLNVTQYSRSKNI